jgi:protein-S-isoprenylcysteine O-methyltransferase Ste14
VWHRLFLAPWLVFLGWWLLRAFGTARTVEKESRGSRVLFVLPMFAGMLLVFSGVPLGPLGRHLWPRPMPLVVTALALEWLGIAFAIWAREALGKLWSGTVTLKEGHRVVRSGPFRYVRHPIYAGVLLALVGLGLVRANLAALIALPLVVAGLRYKIATEERLLLTHLGDEYRDYQRHVRALIPFIL